MARGLLSVCQKPKRTFMPVQYAAEYGASFWNVIHCANEKIYTVAAVTNDMRG